VVPSPFDELVAWSDPAMVIVTTVADGERSGCLVGFHAQCGMEPPRYAVWLSELNHTARIAAAAQHFAVHWVPADRHDLAELFGGTTGDEIDKFARCDWTEGPGGVPLLAGCPDRFVGRRIDWLEMDADHRCVILEPVLAERSGAAADVLRLADATDIDPGHAATEPH
jgi:flavin reductase (DIM6/NTAB) family NADH-FMN oxidoreductase RutF